MTPPQPPLADPSDAAVAHRLTGAPALRPWRPRSSSPVAADDATTLPWEALAAELPATGACWLTTLGPGGGPHTRPVLTVWVDHSLCFATSMRTRKGGQLASDPRCSIGAATDTLHVVAEGTAALVRDEASLRRVADAYARTHGWPVEIVDGRFWADGAPTAGPPPFDVLQLVPTAVWAFGADGTAPATRWRF